MREYDVHDSWTKLKSYYGDEIIWCFKTTFVWGEFGKLNFEKDKSNTELKQKN